MARITKSTEYLRHNFSQDERLTMGSDLAAAHNSMSAIEEEETYIKATFKERKASIEQTIGKLSRDLGSGFTMVNVPCKWVYDSPNVGEVQYVRDDTGEVVKTRAMTHTELQQEIPFDEPVAVNPQTPEDTEAAVDAHFGVENGYTPGFSEEPAPLIVEVAPEEARQSMITMGDAKKGRKSKATEANA